MEGSAERRKMRFSGLWGKAPERRRRKRRRQVPAVKMVERRERREPWGLKLAYYVGGEWPGGAGWLRDLFIFR